MATTPTKTEKKPAKVPALRVRSCSPSGTFRRAGEEFSREPRTIPLADLRQDQIKRIREEPMLVVEDVEIDADGDQVDPETA